MIQYLLYQLKFQHIIWRKWIMKRRFSFIIKKWGMSKVLKVTSFSGICTIAYLDELYFCILISPVEFAIMNFSRSNEFVTFWNWILSSFWWKPPRSSGEILFVDDCKNCEASLPIQYVSISDWLQQRCPRKWRKI